MERLLVVPLCVCPHVSFRPIPPLPLSHGLPNLYTVRKGEGSTSAKGLSQIGSACLRRCSSPFNGPALPMSPSSNHVPPCPVCYAAACCRVLPRRFEDFVLDPEGYLHDILEWIGIPGTEGASRVEGADETKEGVEPSAPSSSTPEFRLETQVSKSTNRKYEEQYCSALRRDPNLVSKHLRLSLKLGDRVKAFGYDLDSFPCVQSILRRVLEEENRAEEAGEEGPILPEGTSAVSAGEPG